MPKENIKSTLNKLRASLEKIENPDQELTSLLKQLDADIQQILSKNESTSVSNHLMERVQEIGARFASEHPHLDPILRDLADMLGKMGV